MPLGVDGFVVANHVCPQLRVGFGFLRLRWGINSDNHFGNGRFGFISIQKALSIQGNLPVNHGTPKIGVQEKGKTGSEHQQHQSNEKGAELTVSHGHSLRCCQQCSGKSVRQWQ